MRATKMTHIHLVLTDDWELYGDGSGNMRRIQFDTMRQLVDIYDRFGLRGTFNVEVMQQLYHLRYGQKNPDLSALAQEWEALVQEVYAKGHDIQLHVHPQWYQARYDNGRWQLNNRWSILDYPPEDARNMIQECKGYLEMLLSSLHPHYRCVAFRSGAWFLAPSDYMLPMLADFGIRCDMSITRGLYFNLDIGKLDYREIDESFLPFYPQMHDARRLADGVQPIVCVPTHSVGWGIGAACFGIVRKGLQKVLPSPLSALLHPYVFPPDAAPIRGSDVVRDYYQQQWDQRTSRVDKFRNKVSAALKSRADRVSDLSTLSYLEMRAVIRDIRRRAQASGQTTVPVVLENHTKNIGDFRPIEQFCAYISQAQDIDVITSRDLVHNLQAGLYPISSKLAGFEN
jgi:hypothetical protein